MNNGNFFPNIDQNQSAPEQPISLNAMNNQAIGSPIPNFAAATDNQIGNVVPAAPSPVETNIPPMPETPIVEPTMPEVPIVEPTMAPPGAETTAPMIQEPIAPIETPIIEPTTAPPAVEESAPMIQEPIAPIETPIVEPTVEPQVAAATPIEPEPTITNGPPIVEPTITEEALPEVVPVTPIIEPPMPEETTQFNDPPLFNSNPEPTYEVPVTTPQEPISNGDSKITIVQDFLNQNGIAYKTYSNATGNCIIIEL